VSTGLRAERKRKASNLVDGVIFCLTDIFSLRDGRNFVKRVLMKLFVLMSGLKVENSKFGWKPKARVLSTLEQASEEMKGFYKFGKSITGSLCGLIVVPSTSVPKLQILYFQVPALAMISSTGLAQRS
jgi:hypothetical protein